MQLSEIIDHKEAARVLLESSKSKSSKRKFSEDEDAKLEINKATIKKIDA